MCSILKKIKKLMEPLKWNPENKNLVQINCKTQLIDRLFD